MNIRIVSDPYLSSNNLYNRLYNEYKKYGKLIIAYDFDDTVYDFHRQGYLYTRIIELLNKWRGRASFIVFTAASEERYPEMIKYLTDNDIPFDFINENDPDMNIPRGKKIYYNALLDDRAGLKTIYEVLLSLITNIEKQEKKNDMGRGCRTVRFDDGTKYENYNNKGDK